MDLFYIIFFFASVSAQRQCDMQQSRYIIHYAYGIWSDDDTYKSSRTMGCCVVRNVFKFCRSFSIQHYVALFAYNPDQ